MIKWLTESENETNIKDNGLFSQNILLLSGIIKCSLVFVLSIFFIMAQSKFLSLFWKFESLIKSSMGYVCSFSQYDVIYLHEPYVRSWKRQIGQ